MANYCENKITAAIFFQKFPLKMQKQSFRILDIRSKSTSSRFRKSIDFRCR